MKNQTLRIIGGHLKSRRINFPNISHIALRPTPDRVRETLFNWLALKIENKNCLDAFAGSGALGIEALSRGAKSCMFYEKNRKVAQQLQKNLNVLELTNHTKIINQPFKENTSLLNEATKPYDLIFLDPPFNQGLVPDTLNLIDKNNLLSKNGLVYFETEGNFDLEKIPNHYPIIKYKKSGDVLFGLLQRD